MAQIKIIISILVFGLAIANAQENANWYFGKHCGINFNEFPAVNDPQSQIDQWEGCATISDEDGNLLFYTDGITVWKKNHQEMVTGLNGHYSSLVSAYIVKQPGTEDIYYLFTIDAAERKVYGICYTIIDMSDGYGTVIKKNVPLFIEASPRIAATHHANGRDLWIVTTKQFTSEVQAYLLTDEGIEKKPVKSFLPDNFELDKGFMKFNCDGDRIYMANTKLNEILILEFDKLTAEASIKHRIYKDDGVQRWFYSLELSPDNDALYATTFNPTRIYRFDLSSDVQADIIESMHIVDEKLSTFYWSGIEVAPNGSIYVAVLDSSFLSVIVNPNADVQQLTFIDKGYDLGDGVSQHGLPTFLKKSCLTPLHLEINADPKEYCEGDTIRISSYGIDNGDFEWITPHGDKYYGKDLVIPDATTAMAGVYELQVTHNGFFYSVKEIINVQPLPDFSIFGQKYICVKDSAVVKIIESEEQDIEYLWSDGEKGSSRMFYEEGTYYVTGTTTFGCTAVDSITITLLEPLHVKIEGFKTICKRDTSVLSTNFTGSRYEFLWSTGDTTETIKVTKSGKYSVTVFEKGACYGKDEIQMNVIQPANTDISGNRTQYICVGDTIELMPENMSEGAEYSWEDGYATLVREVFKTGEYILVSRNDEGCLGYDTVTVIVEEYPVAEIFPPDTLMLCEGESVYLEARNVPKNAQINWSTGDISNTIEVSESGTYYLSIGTLAGCFDTAYVEVIVSDDLSVIIDGDKILCGDATTILSTNFYSEGYIYEWSTGDTTSSIEVSESGEYSLSVISPFGCTGEGSFTVNKLEQPSAELNHLVEVELCTGDSVELYPIEYDVNYNYYWEDGLLGANRMIYQSGTYKLFAANGGNCIDSAEVIINFIEIPQAIIGHPDTLSLCYNPQIKLTIEDYDPKYIYNWSTGETTSEITVTEGGVYVLKAENSLGCFTVDTVTIQSNSDFETEIIASGTSICEGSTVTLELSNTFSEYLWSTGETSHQITVDSPGSFYVNVVDEFGCTGRDTVEIKLTEIEIVNLGDDKTQFGNICFTDKAAKTINLISTKSDVVIESITIDDPSFIISENLDGKYLQGEEISIPIEYSPFELGAKTAFLTVEISEPCQGSYVYELAGSAYAETQISAPNVTANIDIKDYCIPISFKQICDLPENMTSDYSLKVAFEAIYFDPKSTDRSIIQSNTIVENKRVLELTGNFDFNSDILTNICGHTLLGLDEPSKIEILDFAWDEESILNTTIDGTLSIEGVCVHEFFDLNFFSETETKISPNPATEYLTVDISTEEKGKISVLLSDITGRIIKKENFNNEGKNQYNIIFDVSQYNSGSYVVKVLTPTKMQTKRIIILK